LARQVRRWRESEGEALPHLDPHHYEIRRLSAAKDFGTLYAHPTCEDAVLMARSTGHHYTEFSAYLELVSVLRIAKEAVRRPEVPETAWKLYDLESRLGKAVLAAALTSVWGECVGFEASSKLFAAAEEIREAYEGLRAPYDSQMVQRTPVRFLRGEAGTSSGSSLWASGATVVMVSTTRYDQEAMARLGRLAEPIPVGGVLVCVGKPLGSPLFELSSVVDVGMNWGSTKAFIQRKTALPCPPPQL